MTLRTLRFKIRQDGRVEETVEGIVGEGCIDLTEKLEAALGSVEQRKPTSEAFISVLLNDREPSVRYEARTALEQLDNQEVQKKLKSLIDDGLLV